ncbi:hypothetical protein J6590_043872 [Homalodisca vitripennis]|nr:hypothetical protein J6590_043872 [Homalodisca vitripennis]
MLDDTDLETSLTLAAEAGTALLNENSKLREDIQKIQGYNYALEAKLEDLQDLAAKLINNSNLENANDKKVLHPGHCRGNKALFEPKAQKNASHRKSKHLERKEETNLLTTLQARGLTGGISQTPTEKLSTTSLTEETNLLTTLQATEETNLLTTLQARGLTGGISQTPTEKLSTTSLIEETNHLTTVQVKKVTDLLNEPLLVVRIPPPQSDDEDFNIIVVKTDVHHPNLAPKPHKPVNDLTTSSNFTCKPPLNSKILAEGQTLHDFFNRNIAFYKRQIINNNIITAHTENQIFVEAIHRKKAKLKHSQKTRIFTKTIIFINSQLQKNRKQLN